MRRAGTSYVFHALALGTMLALPVNAAAPPRDTAQKREPVKYPQWYLAQQEMGTALGAGRSKDALAIALHMESAPGVPPDKAAGFRASVVAIAMRVKDYPTAAAANDRILAAKDADLDDLDTCVFLAVLQDQIAKAQDCSRRYLALFTKYHERRP